VEAMMTPKHLLPVTAAAVAIAMLLAAAQAPGLLESEFIFENAPFPECHASTQHSRVRQRTRLDDSYGTRG
jgi:hypothetical protein